MSDAAVTVFYLHGFASSARSTKASYFAERLGEHGGVALAELVDDALIEAAQALPGLQRS